MNEAEANQKGGVTSLFHGVTKRSVVYCAFVKTLEDPGKWGGKNLGGSPQTKRGGKGEEKKRCAN